MSRWAHVLIGVASSSPLWFLCWMALVLVLWYLLAMDGDVEGWAAGDPVRKDGEVKEGVCRGGL